MKVLICIQNKEKAIVVNSGNTLESLTMLTAISKNVAERMKRDKKIQYEEAIEFIANCITDVCK